MADLVDSARCGFRVVVRRAGSEYLKADGTVYRRMIGQVFISKSPRSAF
ncbi:hypothetical protein D918_04124 [Trichuris suis]|nr:hypothetical protein D918_04124 [Trichuris suis]